MRLWKVAPADLQTGMYSPMYALLQRRQGKVNRSWYHATQQRAQKQGQSRWPYTSADRYVRRPHHDRFVASPCIVRHGQLLLPGSCFGIAFRNLGWSRCVVLCAYVVKQLAAIAFVIQSSGIGLPRSNRLDEVGEEQARGRPVQSATCASFGNASRGFKREAPRETTR